MALTKITDGVRGTVGSSQITSLVTSKLTGTVTDAQIAAMAASKLTGALPAIDGSNLTGVAADINQLNANVALNFFLDAIDHARSIQNLQDGWTDQFEDQTGVDDTNSINETYDASNDLYESSGSSNMILMSEPVVALAAPTKAHVTLFKQDVDAVTLNTDLLAWVSRSKQTVTSDFGTDEKLDATGHGLVNTDRVIITSSAGDVPAGLSQDVVYFVVNKTTNDFEVSLSSSGSAVNITDNGTGTHSVHAVTAVTLVDEGTYSSYDIIAASVDISAQPSDTDMVLFVQSKNTKEFKLHGQALLWEN